jgi:hypothetical protein
MTQHASAKASSSAFRWRAHCETLDAVADRGYYDSEEIRACEESGITVTLPKPMTSGAKAAGRFGKEELLPGL